MVSMFFILFVFLLHSSACAMNPLYGITASFETNLSTGPRIPHPMPIRKPSTQSVLSLFGYPIASPIGIAACPLTTSKGIALAAKLGYDILTYKTIRSSASPVKSSTIHYVDAKNDMSMQDQEKQYTTLTQEPSSYETLAITNSFGINSRSADETVKDITAARAALQEGQVLIVSIYGSGQNVNSQIQDFVRAATLAVQGGAQILEANLSCPNLGNTQPVYQQPELVYEICKALTTAFPTIPLVIKVGVFENKQLMKSIFLAAHNGGARGICGINSVPVAVVDAQGDPVYQHTRLSGLSGAPIAHLALQFVKDARAIIQKEKLDLVLFGTGGITTSHQFATMLQAGADVALSATGAMFNERLAIDYHNHTMSKY